MSKESVVNPVIVDKFSYIQRCVKGNNGEQKHYRRLSDIYHLGNKETLKSLISGIFISSCLGVNGYSYTLTESLEILSHYFKILIDVNGLKPVNDWVGHEKGDILLERIVCCLMYNKAIVHFIKHFNIHFSKKSGDNGFDFVPYADLRKADKEDYFIQLFREGGDEFSMVCYCPDYPVGTFIPSEGWNRCQPDDSSKRLSIVAVFRSLIIDRISMIYIGNLINYQCIIEKIDEFGLGLYNATEGNFKFYASVAGGEIVFDQVLLSYLDNHNVLFTDYNRVLFGDSLMGATQNSVDNIIGRRKNRYKKYLMNSDNPCEVFEGYVITRSAETRRLFGVVKKIQHQTCDLVSGFSKTQADILQSLEDELKKMGVSNNLVRNMIIRAKNNLEIFSRSVPEIIKKTLANRP